jgi:hypothetical protein
MWATLWQKMNRSAFIRQALQQHLKRLRELTLEEQDRRGYLAHPQRQEEFRLWEDAATWPPPLSTPAAAPARPPIPAAAS